MPSGPPGGIVAAGRGDLGHRSRPTVGSPMAILARIVVRATSRPTSASTATRSSPSTAGTSSTSWPTACSATRPDHLEHLPWRLELRLQIDEAAASPRRRGVQHALLDQVRPVDNHCEFFIYAHRHAPKPLPQGQRLAVVPLRQLHHPHRFTGDLDGSSRRCRDSRLGCHATRPRARRAAQPAGAGSCAGWALLDHGIDVHGQIVVCRARRTGSSTHPGRVDRFPKLATLHRARG